MAQGGQHGRAGEADRLGCTIDGNELRVLAHGPERLAALIELILNARESLKLFYYIFAADNSGRLVLDALVEARRRGVAVTLMVDAFGSTLTPAAFFAPLRAAGGEVIWFGSGWSTRYLIRNHQKIAIADDSRALIGGFNVADGYFKAAGDDGWHDLGLLIEGPDVAPLVRWFHLLSVWMGGVKSRFRRLRAMVRGWRPGVGRFQWLIGGPTYRLSPWARMVRSDLERARRVDMIAAYFSPGRQMLQRLGQVGCQAQAPGEGARLILPSRSDNGATIAASRLLYGPLVRRGVEICEYLPGKLHMKLIVIDDAVYIGSANFDMRSLFLNLELMLRIEDAGFAASMRAFVDNCARDSLPITQDVLQARKRPLRLLKGWISYFLVAVLDYTVTRRLNFRDTVPMVDRP